MFKAIDFMTPSVVRISKDATVKEAAILLKSKSVSGLIVVEDNKPVGIITERDIVGLVAGGREPRAVTVSMVMSSPLSYVNAEDSFNSVIRLMMKTHFKRIPVVENSKLVGVISQSDVIRNFFKLGRELQDKLDKGEISEGEFAKRHKAILSNLEKVESKKSMVSWHMRCELCHKTFFVDEIDGKLTTSKCPHCESTKIEHVK